MQFIDPVYQYPIIPGYNGFIPNMESKIGKRFMAAATAGIAEHEQLLEMLRCERRSLERRDVLENSNGRFNAKLRERMVGLNFLFGREEMLQLYCRSQVLSIAHL